MCGRYRLTRRGAEWTPRFEVELPPDSEDDRPRYNIAPTQSAFTVRQTQDFPRREAVSMRWGLIPHWAKDLAIGNRLINARCETILEKPAFRESFKKRRCLIPADGFYEWKKDGARKLPFNIGMKDDSVFAFAGLWDEWRSPEGRRIESFTILTTDANPLLKPLHERMPVILPREHYAAWLDPARLAPRELCELLVPFDAGSMRSYPINPVVNSPRHDAPDCIAPFAAS